MLNKVLSTPKHLLPPKAGSRPEAPPKYKHFSLLPSPHTLLSDTSSSAQLSVLLSETATVRPKQLQKASLCLVTSAESQVKSFISKD